MSAGHLIIALLVLARVAENQKCNCVPGSLNPAYAKHNHLCPDPSAGRVVKLVNNCLTDRWFKLNGLVTPTWVTRPACPWSNIACVLTPGTDPLGSSDCQNKIQARLNLGLGDTGTVHCRDALCACNPFFLIHPGDAHEIPVPAGKRWRSGAGWLATGCNTHGEMCSLGNTGHLNSLFEFTYDLIQPIPKLWYDISAVNSWTSISSVGMKPCGETQSADLRCQAIGCNFDLHSQCPNGKGTFVPGPGPDGNSANLVPTGTVFHPNKPTNWTWSGPPDAFQGWGLAEGLQGNRRYKCTNSGCKPTAVGNDANTCMGACDLCLNEGYAATGKECIKYCCPNIVKSYSNHTYRFDSPGCLALGVQNGTNYTPNLRRACPFVYTYSYEDASSTFTCPNKTSLMVMSCPKDSDYPSTVA